MVQPVERQGLRNDMERFAVPPGTTTVDGVLERDGVHIAYAVHGSGPVTVVLMPTWSILPSRFWKAQVPYLSRH